MKSSAAFNFANIDANGVAPECRIPTSNDAYCIADQLRRDNWQREQRWASVYKCYKRFPPTDYSQIAKKQLFGLSNIPFGQLTFEIDDKKSAFIDMVTDRSEASRIITKLGNPKEKHEWSKVISLGWDRALWAWKSYFYNIDQDLEEMLLFGKGIEIRTDPTSWFSRSFRNSQVLIPENTRADLDNLGEFVIRESYKPLEFWKKFKDSKDRKDTGWNFWACLDALRHYTNHRDFRLTTTQYLQKIAAGDVNFNQYYNVQIDVYIIYSKEWNGKITKGIVLQNYTPLAQMRGTSPEDYISKAGYLYHKQTSDNDWDDVIWAMHGAAGSGLWHEIKGYGEDIFPAARRYDISMNKVMDGVDAEMMLPIKGMGADATSKLKKMEWGRFFVLPDDVDFAQKQFQLPINDAMQATQMMMQDTYRGVSSFNQVKPRPKRTLGEAELEFAEEAKLDGTQLRRFNLSQTRWQRGLFKKFVQSKVGYTGYEIFEKFKEFMAEQGVPTEAYQWDNIEHMASNMLPGAGSPANKFIASTRVAELAGASAINEGQENAYRDAIAHLVGRENVEVYRPKRTADLPDEVRVIAFENGILTNPMANPENARVMPSDNHVEHIRGHFSDAMQAIDNTMQGIQSGQIDAQGAKDSAMSILLKGGHIMAHMQFLAQDKSKMALVKTLSQSIDQLKAKTDELLGVAQEMAEAEPKGPELTDEQRKLELKIAEKQIDLDAKQKASDLKLATTAQKAQQRLELDRERAAQALAIERAKAKTPKPRRSKPDSGE